MSELKILSPRISEHAYNIVSKLAKTPTAGATVAIEGFTEIVEHTGLTNYSDVIDVIQSFKMLKLYTIRAIKGRFTADEIKCLTDALNGTLITPDFACNNMVLVASVEDGEALDGVCTKWGVKVDEITKKIQALTAAEVLFIIETIKDFWNNPEKLDEFAESFV